MGKVRARRQVTNCAGKSSELRATCVKQTITLAVIVLGLLSTASNGQVGGPVAPDNFGLHINGGFANLSPRSDDFSNFGKFGLWDNGIGSQSYLLDPKVPRQPKPATGKAATVSDTEVVLHNFASPPNGAYP